MNEAIAERLRAQLGPAAVERDPAGLPRAIPESEEAVALVCRTAQEEGWRIRVEGRATWLPPDAPADLALSTRGLDRILSVSPADLVATVQAGVPLDALRRQLADQGMWLGLDPPGRPERTIGSVIATGTSGPLRQGYGPVRDHVLGCAVVTGDGRVIRAGGRVVKNVAGYDLTKLQVG
ncbi:MAG: FAD-binding oxidoreductase, partial [Gemmatimonadota bacterium]